MLLKHIVCKLRFLLVQAPRPVLKQKMHVESAISNYTETMGKEVRENRAF